LESAISPVKTQVLECVDAVRLWRRNATVKGERVGFVPTMGALHEGHLSLMRAARNECDRVVASIFVNPLQFAPHEDFGKYPRTFQRDLELMSAEGVDAVFYPNEKEMYPEGRESVTRVVPPCELADCLEGHFRPGFFTGVATVVAKLFNIVLPEAAFFGEKDYQQLLVVKRMVGDLNLPIQVTPVATVREADGLALSSRNVYLSEEERKIAPMLNRTLNFVKDAAQSGQLSLEAALEKGRADLKALPDVELQYLEARQADTFQPAAQFELPMVVVLAAKLKNVRLIDNVVVR
jgi:pantoate--beta-alanine ligase